jgi:hypothetical protein
VVEGALPQERCVLRLALAGLIALGGPPGAAPPQANVDCTEAYEAYVQDLEGRKISPERRAALHRWALRAYDACQTGDLEEGIKGLFEGLDRRKY